MIILSFFLFFASVFANDLTCDGILWLSAGTRLYTFDVWTQTVSLVGGPFDSTIYDIAWGGPGNHLYGFLRDPGFSKFVEFLPNGTGYYDSYTVLWNTTTTPGLGASFALEVDCNGTAYINAPTNTGLSSLNIETGEVQVILLDLPVSSGDLALFLMDGFLYYTASGGLRQIDLQTLTVTLITTAFSFHPGIISCNNTLYGVSSDNLYFYNSTADAAVLVANINGIFFAGMSTNKYCDRQVIISTAPRQSDNTLLIILLVSILVPIGTMSCACCCWFILAERRRKCRKEDRNYKECRRRRQIKF